MENDSVRVGELALDGRMTQMLGYKYPLRLLDNYGSEPNGSSKRNHQKRR